MRKLLPINDSFANKLSYCHALLLLCSLPFDYFYSHIILISWIAHTLINFKKADVKPMFTLQNVVLQLVFLITLIGTAFTSYKHQAAEELGRQVVILIFPVLFCVNPLDIQKYRNQLFAGFSLCCTMVVGFLYANVLRVIRFYHLPIKAVFSPAFTNHNFSDAIGMHATFFSLQVAFALVYLITVVIGASSKRRKLFYACCCAILLAALIQLSSKSVVAVVFLTVNFVLPFFLMAGRWRIIFLVASFSVSLGAMAVLSRSDTFRERFIQSFTNDLSKKPVNEISDSRLLRWAVITDLIKQAPVLGHGEGSEIPLLKENFFDRKLYDSFLNGLNSHNQYLSFWLKSGIGALLVYIFTLCYGFRAAFINRDVMLFTFMLLIAVVSLSENVLDVDKGTMFYGFFFSFFIFSLRDRSAKKLPFNQTGNNEIYFGTRATAETLYPCQ